MTVAGTTLRPRLERARARLGLPAIGAALVARDGIVASDVVGLRVRGGPDAVTPADRWHVGSCGKAITCAHYALLVETGRAAWGASVTDLLPDLAAGAHPGWRGIAIDAVLTHRAGLPEVPARTLDRLALDPRPAAEQRTELVARALAAAPREAGTFHYSNLGYVLAGAAIERIAGRPWEEAVAADVLEPLGMADAGFGPPPGAQPWGHPPRWRGRGRGAALAPGDPTADNPPVLGPAGRLHVTLEAWSRFVRVVLCDGGDLLRPDTLEYLLTPASGPGPRQAMGWAFPEGAAAPVAFGAQGSNLRWTAAVLVAADRQHAALVVCNDGRPRLLAATAALAVELLRDGPGA